MRLQHTSIYSSIADSASFISHQFSIFSRGDFIKKGLLNYTTTPSTSKYVFTEDLLVHLHQQKHYLVPQLCQDQN